MASQSRLHRLLQPLERRLRVVRACEVKLSGQWHGGWQIVRRAIKRSRMSMNVAFSVVLPELIMRAAPVGF